MKANHTPESILQSFINDDIDYVSAYQETFLDMINLNTLHMRDLQQVNDKMDGIISFIDSVNELLRDIKRSEHPYPEKWRKTAKEIFEEFTICNGENGDAEDALDVLSGFSVNLMDMTFVALANYRELSGTDQEKELRRENIEGLATELHDLIKSLKSYYEARHNEIKRGKRESEITSAARVIAQLESTH